MTIAKKKMCVFCDREIPAEEHTCGPCNDYKGVVPARECPSCLRLTFAEDDECPHCGADMEND